MEPAVRTQLEKLRERYRELTEEMARPDVAADYERVAQLAKERAELDEIVQLFEEYERVERDAEAARGMLKERDPELRDLAESELQSAERRLEELDKEIVRRLLPKDPRDKRNVIVEIRAGAGGEEAALFAADLFRMYTRYAERHGWKTEVLSASESDRGGFKEVIFEVKGEGAYSRLKYESGVHRVQRVPETEAQGRIHTSTATVAVLPEAEEVDVEIDEKDLKIDFFHSSGAGGQNVNKVATAVRITHLPTGIVVTCQDERSQLKNRLKAMTILRSRLLDMEQRKRDEEIGEARRRQVGTGERSEKIRTYNFPQDRITDHRIGLTVHNLPDRLDGDIDDIIDAVAAAAEAERLQESLA
ncbi:Peptide chain release factor 1 [bacterium HR29]|jgi:peptide chain release factor 1|nr:Peptide chain release factor 1 [bacterium HR29]